MTRIALVGLGEVGVRAARQLVETDIISEVVLVGRDSEAAKSLANSLGPKAVVGVNGQVPESVDGVAIAVPEPALRGYVAQAVGFGIPAAVCLTSAAAARSLLEFDDAASRADVTVVAGAGFQPGLSEVLVAHAATLFDRIEEIKIAAVGWAGPCCADSVAVTGREPTRRRRDRHHEPINRTVSELVWFPDPIGARDCQLVTSSLDVLEATFSDAPHLSIMRGDDMGRRWFGRKRFGDDGQWGAVRCEVWGRTGDAIDVVVYGVVERTAVAAGATLALSATGVATGVGLKDRPTGVVGLGAVVDPVAFLRDLAARGIHAAVFEGAPLT